MKGILLQRMPGWFSLALAVGYLVAGLWPFAFRPVNRVSWLKDRPGLHFEPNGIARDPAPLPPPLETGPAGEPARYSVELWVKPDMEPDRDVSHIFTLHEDRLPSNFVLCQWKTYILLRTPAKESRTTRGFREAGVTNALVAGNTRFITVTGDPAGTDFYLDGRLAEHVPAFTVNAGTFRGQMILGDAASGKHAWAGRLFGVAVFNRALDAAAVAQHHALWTHGHAGQLAGEPGLAALYLFDEGGSRRAEDRSGNEHQLTIPAIYAVPCKQVLIPPWREVSYILSRPMDMVVNVSGFVPFGFFFFMWRALKKPRCGLANALVVLLAAAAVSLTIELIQVWLPDRQSSATDLICNMAGTLCGVILALPFRGKNTPAQTA